MCCVRMLQEPCSPVGVSGRMPPVNTARSVDGGYVWVSCSLSFLPILISMFFFFVFFVLAVIQGHYVILMRAPHLEKDHLDSAENKKVYL